MARTVLIVDDSDYLRQLLKLCLMAEGYSIIEASNGQTALELMDGRNIEVVITDFKMPVMDGMTFIRSTKLCAQYQNTPIVMLTAVNDPSMIAEGIATGVSAWVIKPFSLSMLVGPSVRFV